MYVCMYLFLACKFARVYTCTYTTIDSHLPLSGAGPEASAGKLSARPSPPSDAADCGRSTSSAVSAPRTLRFEEPTRRAGSFEIAKAKYDKHKSTLWHW